MRKKKRIKVTFQGEIGAYSEEAAFQFFGNYIETLPCQNLADVFEAVEKIKPILILSRWRIP